MLLVSTHTGIIEATPNKDMVYPRMQQEVYPLERSRLTTTPVGGCHNIFFLGDEKNIYGN